MAARAANPAAPNKKLAGSGALTLQVPGEGIIRKVGISRGDFQAEKVTKISSSGIESWRFCDRLTSVQMPKMGQVLREGLIWIRKR
jgi:hypothetical protein